MGLTRDLCFFIVVEQIILGNIQLVRSVSNFAAKGFGHSNAILWAQMPTGFILILVAVILVQGLLERKTGKFIPWIIVNALGCLIITVTTIVILFEKSIITQMFEISGSISIIYIVMLIITVLQWTIWITVLVYYRHLKLKEIERKINAEEANIENPTEQTFLQYPKMFDNQPQLRNVLYNQNETAENPAEQSVIMQYPKLFDNQSQLRNVQYSQREMEEQIPLNRLYPIPTAPDQ